MSESETSVQSLPEEASASASPYQDTTLTGRPVWPFHTSGEALKASRKFSDRSLRRHQIYEIIQRLDVSPAEVSIAAVEEILKVFKREDMTTRHAFLDLFKSMIEKEADFSDFTDDLARFLNDPNYALREKVCEVICLMGASAIDAETRALGCTRHGVRDIRLAGVKVLGAIGPECAGAAVPRLNRMLQGVEGRDSDMATEIRQALDNIAPKSSSATQNDAAETDLTRARINPAVSIVLAIHKVAHSHPSDETLALFAERLKLKPALLRMKALLSSLSVKSPLTRLTATRILIAHPEDAAPFQGFIKNACAREQNAKTRVKMKELLKEIEPLAPKEDLTA